MVFYLCLFLLIGPKASDFQEQNRYVSSPEGHGPHESDIEGQPTHAHAGSGRTAVTGRLLLVLGATSIFMIAEVIGGVLSNSLALLADAGHMLTDVAALARSLFAMRLARKPPTSRRTFGYVRLEILAALVNGATLLVISGLIIFEAWERLWVPAEIDGVMMLTVAVLGLGVNAAAALLLHRDAHENLNVRGAYLHILSDLFGSLGALVGGIVILTTGWTLVDPVISVFIALLILISAWHLVREAADILLESAPSHLDMSTILGDLREIDGLEDVHDVHVWTLTSGFIALSGHGVINDPAHHMRILGEVRERMRTHGIEHVTFQIELVTLHQL